MRVNQNRHDHRRNQNDSEQQIFPGRTTGTLARSTAQACFARRAKIDVEQRARQHTDPASQHVWPEFYRSQAIQIIAQVKWNERAQAQQEYELGTLLPDRSIDLLKPLVTTQLLFNLVTRNIARDQERQGRSSGRSY